MEKVYLGRVNKEQIEGLCRRTLMTHEEEWQCYNGSEQALRGVWHNGELVGLVDYDEKICHINLLEVGEDYRGQGIGKAVVYKLLTEKGNVRGEVTGDAEPASHYFWLSIGARVEQSLYALYELQREAIENGGDGVFAPFSLTLDKFKRTISSSEV